MNLTDEQTHVRRELAATLRILGRAGFEMGSAGHITVADPAATDRFWGNPFGVPFADTDPEDIVQIDLEGRVVFGDHECKAAWTQTPIYAVRPDIRAVVHVHGLNTMAFSNFGQPFRALTTESAEIYSLQTVQGEGQPTVEALQGTDKKIVMSRFHGCTTAGATLAEAAFYTLAVERAAYTELLLADKPGVEQVPDSVIEKWTITPELAEGDFRQEIERELRTMQDNGR